jgi:hypothetical protein
MKTWNLFVSLNRGSKRLKFEYEKILRDKKNIKIGHRKLTLDNLNLLELKLV